MRFVIQFCAFFCALLPLLAHGSKQSVHFERLSIEKGLSQGSVFAIAQDKQGFIWVATYDGLNRFDGYQFKHYRHDSDDPGSISGSSISTLFVDSKGTLWVGTDQNGLNRFDHDNETFQHFTHNPDDNTTISENLIAAISEDSKGRIWVATRNRGVNLLNQKDGTFLRFGNQENDSSSLSHNQINKMIADRQGNIWISTPNGLNRYDDVRGKFIHVKHEPNNPNSLSSNTLHGLYADSQGFLWVGSDLGLNRINLKTGEVKRFVHDPNDSQSINHDRVWTIVEDGSGDIWVGTDAGVAWLEPELGTFTRLEHRSNDPTTIGHNGVIAAFRDSGNVLWFGTSGGGVNKLDLEKNRFGHFKNSGPDTLSHNLVMSFYQDEDLNLWVGTDGGGLNRIDAVTGEFTIYRHQLGNEKTIASDRVWNVLPAENGLFWVGTFGKGLHLFDPVKGEVVRTFQFDPKDNRSISGDWIYKLTIDSKGRLWIGSGEGGLSRYNPDTDDFIRFNHDPARPGSISSDMVVGVFEDSSGRFWVATDTGINRFDGESDHFVRYQSDEKDPGSIGNNFVLSIFQDKDGSMWFGSVGGGLSRYNEDADDFSNFGVKEGLPNNIVYGILQDDDGYLWLSTNKGLAKFDVKTGKVRGYDRYDGLQSDEFNGNAYYRGRQGEFFFGGINGFNRFFPEDMRDNDIPPKVAFTDFMLFNQSVPVNADEQHFGLEKSINQLDVLQLDYKQNLMTFEFTAFSYNSPNKNRFQYKLEGFDQNWLEGDARIRRATYTNLPAGEYTMKVRAANPDGFWSERNAEIKLIIGSAPWFSWWAIAIYLVIFSSAIFGFIHHRINSNKMRNELKYMERLKQLDKLKDAFLANTSHELRTPLNGIIGLAEALMDGSAGKLPARAHQDLAMVVTSGKRLANLVNDILDLSKLKEHNIELNNQPVDLKKIVDTVLSLSKPLAKDKGLHLLNDVSEQMVTVYADEDRLLQILHNLVGNGVKFTDNGSVTITARREYDEVIIEVIDTGIGIEQGQLQRIFESFEQIKSNDERVHGGTGLGLAISKQLLQLHGSEIEVDSFPGKGSTFRFRLPVSGKMAVNKTHIAETLVLEQVNEDDIEVTQSIEGSRFRLLVVDDEPINRQVLRNHLSAHEYQIVEAEDGVKALELLESQGPFDMVLLDVMMPHMSGTEVCSQIRQKWSVSELPVIFLTAKNQVQDVVLGFTVGANDHIAKPVSKQELLSRVATHLKLLDVNRNLDKIIEERTDQIKLAQKKLVLSEKLAALGTLMAGVAHEINNPTNFVNVSVQNLEADLTKCKQFIFDLAGEDADPEILDSFQQQFSPLEQHIVTIKDGTERIKGIVKDLKSSTYHDESEKQRVNVCDMLTSTMNLFATQYKSQIKVVENFKDQVEIDCFPSKLNQVVMNLLVNASDAILARDANSIENVEGLIEVGCRVTQSRVEISVSDNGPGISDEAMEHLFEPFYTTKDIDSGTGLGLSISYDIVQKHEGDILVDSIPGKGTTFRVILPKEPETADADDRLLTI